MPTKVGQGDCRLSRLESQGILYPNACYLDGVDIASHDGMSQSLSPLTCNSIYGMLLYCESMAETMKAVLREGCGIPLPFVYTVAAHFRHTDCIIRDISSRGCDHAFVATDGYSWKRLVGQKNATDRDNRGRNVDSTTQRHDYTVIPERWGGYVKRR